MIFSFGIASKFRHLKTLALVRAFPLLRRNDRAANKRLSRRALFFASPDETLELCLSLVICRRLAEFSS
jgi:hypothetical protein